MESSIKNVANQIFIFLLVFFSYGNMAYATEILYSGEKYINVNQCPTLIKFIKGDSNKPLIVFIPGFAHLARISYGCPSCDPGVL